MTAALFMLALIAIFAWLLWDDVKWARENKPKPWHPSQGPQDGGVFENAQIVDVRCGCCHTVIYRIAATSEYDATLVLLAEHNDYETARAWHDSHECPAKAAA